MTSTVTIQGHTAAVTLESDSDGTPRFLRLQYCSDFDLWFVDRCVKEGSIHRARIPGHHQCTAWHKRPRYADACIRDRRAPCKHATRALELLRAELAKRQPTARQRIQAEVAEQPTAAAEGPLEAPPTREGLAAFYVGTKPFVAIETIAAAARVGVVSAKQIAHAERIEGKWIDEELVLSPLNADRLYRECVARKAASRPATMKAKSPAANRSTRPPKIAPTRKCAAASITHAERIAKANRKASRNPARHKLNIKTRPNPASYRRGEYDPRFRRDMDRWWAQCGYLPA